MEAYSAIMSIAHEIKHARRVVALTGAGISAESGLGTFRGKDGLWSKYDPAVVASIESFTRDPRKFWKFAREIGWIFLTAKPNAAHTALAELETMKRLDYVITQNVDGLHQRAGSKRVIEIHGNDYLSVLVGQEFFSYRHRAFWIFDIFCSIKVAAIFNEHHFHNVNIM